MEISLLYDFYGSFLTDKQREAIEYYYNLNYSLSEIGEKMGITRQGVRDQLIRAKELLHSFDEKLGLVDKYQRQQTLLQDSVKGLDEVLSRMDDENAKGSLVQVRKQLTRLMEEA